MVDRQRGGHEGEAATLNIDYPLPLPSLPEIDRTHQPPAPPLTIVRGA
jgi:hypothetical protein